MRKTRILSECALIVALAVMCSFIKVWEMPQGGSIALTMVPLFIISYRRGVGAGVLSGMIYGVISLMFAGVIYHPMSILFDYILAFGIIGISGFFKKNLAGIILGTTVGVSGRFISSFVSGAVLFGNYVPMGQNPWIYSLIYQSTYLVPELFICLAVLIFLYIKLRNIFRI